MTSSHDESSPCHSVHDRTDLTAIDSISQLGWSLSSIAVGVSKSGKTHALKATLDEASVKPPGSHLAQSEAVLTAWSDLDEAMWGEAILEDKLIDLWPDYPCLYDVNLPEFKNRDKREKAMEEMAEKLEQTGSHFSPQSSATTTQ